MVSNSKLHSMKLMDDKRKVILVPNSLTTMP